MDSIIRLENFCGNRSEYDAFWVSISFLTNLLLGETFFICWITLPADLKNRDLKKKIGLETNW